MYKGSDASLLMSVFKAVTANVVSAAKLSPMSRDCCLFSVYSMAEKSCLYLHVKPDWQKFCCANELECEKLSAESVWQN
jgi:hypothetical protein